MTEPLSWNGNNSSDILTDNYPLCYTCGSPVRSSKSPTPVSLGRSFSSPGRNSVQFSSPVRNATHEDSFESSNEETQLPSSENDKENKEQTNKEAEEEIPKSPSEVAEKRHRERMDRLHASLAREQHWESLQVQQEALLLLEKSLVESLTELGTREKDSISQMNIPKKQSSSFHGMDSYTSAEEENIILRKKLEKVKQITANLLSKHLRLQHTNQALLAAQLAQRERELIDCHAELAQQIRLKDEELRFMKRRLVLYEGRKDPNSQTI